MVPKIMVSIVAAFIAHAQPQAIQQSVQLSVPQTECLTEAIYFESRSEGTIGGAAVSYVILNRAAMEGKTICDVIHEKSQFSFYKPNQELQIRESEAWRESAEIAVNTQIGVINNPIGNATFYNTVPVPSWKHVVFVGKIRHHLFYELPSVADAAPLASSSQGVTQLSQSQILRDPVLVPIIQTSLEVIKPTARTTILSHVKHRVKIICGHQESKHNYKRTRCHHRGSVESRHTIIVKRIHSTDVRMASSNNK